MTVQVTVVKFVRNFGLMVSWLVVSSFIFYNYRLEMAHPTPQEHRYYAVDDESSIEMALAIMAVELIVLYLVLRPWSYRRSIGRPLLALLLFVPWTLLSMVVAMHGSSSVFFHFFWLFAIDCTLVVLTIVSAISVMVARR